ncbi:MAG: alpha/beta hydrolase [Caldilineaceae bacterium]|nr:alpha/beta hydrolase [Caldilineaceae bacterium]
MNVHKNPIWLLSTLLATLLAACVAVQAAPLAQDADQQPDSEERTAMWYELDDLKMYYEVHGEGQPVLLLHGSPADHRMMVSALEPIFQERESWQRIYVDLPGMGQTTGGSWLQSNDDVLAVLVQFMDDVYPDQRFLVIGESYGAYLARGLLHEKHAQIDGLFLLAPSVADHPEARILAPHMTIVSNPEGLAQFPSPFDQFFASTLVVQDDAVLAQMQDIVDGILSSDEETLSRIRQRHGFSFAADVLSEPFAKPVLILTGKQDSIVGYEQAGDLLQYYPRATYAVLDRAGHGVNMEQPVIYTLLVNEWLDRVAEEQASAGQPE